MAKVKLAAQKIVNNKVLQNMANKKNKSFKSNFDVNGSYTGTDTFDKYEKPVQDADDL